MCPGTSKLARRGAAAEAAPNQLINMVQTKPLSPSSSSDSIAESFAAYCACKAAGQGHPTCRSVGIEDLDYSTLTTIMSFLSDTRDICSLGLTCKSFYAVLKDQYVWRTMVHQRYQIPVWLSDGQCDFRAMYAKLHQGSRDSRRAHLKCVELEKMCEDGRAMVHVTPPTREGFLSWTGYKTDGGIDNEDHRYWVNNMFSPSPWEAYCSQGSKNIHCLAYLDTANCKRQDARTRRLDECDVVDKVSERRYIIGRLRAVASALFDHDSDGGRAGRELDVHTHLPPAIEAWSTTELEVFLSEIWDIYNHGYPLGQLLFQGVRQSDMAREVAKVRRTVATIEERRDISSGGVKIDSSNRNRLWLDMPEPPSCLPYEQRSVALSHIHCLKISRRGQFSCPVQVGGVLFGICLDPKEIQNLDPSSQEACLRMQSLETEDAVVAASQKGLLPPIVHRHLLPAGIALEFAASANSRPRGERVAGVLCPALWFRFHDKKNDNRHTRSSPLSQDEMNIMLASNGHVANVTCAKLISSENLMSEYDDLHDDPNIDVNFVGFRGSVITMSCAS